MATRERKQRTESDDSAFWELVAALLIARSRRDQAQVAERLAKRWVADWRAIDIHDVYGSTENWLDLVVPDVEQAYFDSQDRMVSFLDNFLLARAKQAGDAPLPPLQVATREPLFTDGAFPAPTLDRERAIGGLVTTGPGSVIKRSPAPPRTVSRAGFSASLGYATATALDGGSAVVEAVAERNPGVIRGWQRVTDSDPCYFCALLASRGPVYKNLGLIAKTDAKWAQSSGLDGHDNGARVHANCKCVLIPVYRDQGEPLDAFAKLADDLWFGNVDGVGSDGGQPHELGGAAAMKEYARLYREYRKNNQVSHASEDLARRKVNEVFQSGKYKQAREKQAIRAALASGNPTLTYL